MIHPKSSSCSNDITILSLPFGNAIDADPLLNLSEKFLLDKLFKQKENDFPMFLPIFSNIIMNISKLVHAM